MPYKKGFSSFFEIEKAAVYSNEKGWKYETKTKQQTRKGQKGIKYYIKSYLK
jgi:hypothetical protein